MLIKTVAQPIEAKVNGVEDMIYMSSVIGNDGSYTLRIYFRVGLRWRKMKRVIKHGKFIAMVYLQWRAATILIEAHGSR